MLCNSSKPLLTPRSSKSDTLAPRVSLGRMRRNPSLCTCNYNCQFAMILSGHISTTVGAGAMLQCCSGSEQNKVASESSKAMMY